MYPFGFRCRPGTGNPSSLVSVGCGSEFYKVFLHKEATLIKDAKTNMAFKVNGISVIEKLSFFSYIHVENHTLYKLCDTKLYQLGLQVQAVQKSGIFF